MGETLIAVLGLIALGLAGLLLVDRFAPEFPADSAADRRRRWWRAQLRPLLALLLAIVVLRGFFLEPFRIPSGSMEPGLTPGDYILVDKNEYGMRLPVARTLLWAGRAPERGETAVFFPPGDKRHFIKRIVGLPGDTLSYRNKKLFINGTPAPQRGSGETLEENIGGVWHRVRYDSGRRARDFTVTVRDGHYFMMGDNRDNSRDSRVWGEVPQRNLIGPAFYLWMHWEGFLRLPHFQRNGTIH